VQREGFAADDAADEAVHERPQASVPEPTGVQTVDAAVERLAELDALPTSEHVAVYDAVHRQLQDALADLDGA
jgi:propanediol dehydratase small subunit